MTSPEDPGFSPGNNPFDPPPEVVVRRPGGRYDEDPLVSDGVVSPHGGTQAPSPGGPVSDAPQGTAIGAPPFVADISYTPYWLPAFYQQYQSYGSGSGSGSASYPSLDPANPGTQAPGPNVPASY